MTAPSWNNLCFGDFLCLWQKWKQYRGMHGDVEISTQAGAHLAGVVITKTSPVVRLVSLFVALVGLKKDSQWQNILMSFCLGPSEPVYMRPWQREQRASVKTPKVSLSAVEQPPCNVAVWILLVEGKCVFLEGQSFPGFLQLSVEGYLGHVSLKHCVKRPLFSRSWTRETESWQGWPVLDLWSLLAASVKDSVCYHRRVPCSAESRMA